uniref:DUF6824 domain-containing protein n=1 Tax=Entomoneis paludosa TaxID=265537 RepID=A0A7S2YTX8_9STRA|mmetsp:Transcript_9961/g.20602  ORF Transcript_9961/g.20602 Transcript_9961/m.20602 type:complete len:678 (+) Transcript_9961:100-2133(+)|eukprot:CAMPEP_0172470352 /NCGR_PEP_ID=MMETSP1065-20121228/66090_1 /TAXON_ID=265537 /ORGANISM="Amphiprora paludosa, Strain CCMP125" /LENGTH=677 /DNA_ID=CAMNT_0013228253 /DNA_START=88 /DNA_END=2121 /DNA_ORIENTATION=-
MGEATIHPPGTAVASGLSASRKQAHQAMPHQHPPGVYAPVFVESREDTPFLRSSSTRARSLVNSFMSPFMNCVNPGVPHGINCACGTCHSPPLHYSSASWGTPSESNNKKNKKAVGASFVTPSPIPPHGKFHGHSRPAPGTPSASPYLRNYAKPTAPSFVTEPVPAATLILQPNENDVLCGRGGGSTNPHHGNARFRQLISSQRDYYRTLTKKQKMMLARQIVDLIHSVGGRFLARENSNSTSNSNGGNGWYDIGLPRSLEKTSQALREKPKTSAAASTPTKEGSSASELSDGGSADIEEDDQNMMMIQRSESRDSDLTVSTVSPSEVTVKKNNKSTSKGKSGSTIEPPKLTLPAHLQGIYGSAVANNGSSVTTKVEAMPTPTRPFLRPVPHPMPCNDFQYRYYPSPSSSSSSSTTSPPSHHQYYLQPSMPQQRTPPPHFNGKHVYPHPAEWNPTHCPPTKIHTLKPPSSVSPTKATPSYFADYTNHFHGSDKPLEQSTPTYAKESPSRRTRAAVSQPSVRKNEDPIADENQMVDGNENCSPLREQLWKRPRIVMTRELAEAEMAEEETHQDIAMSSLGSESNSPSLSCSSSHSSSSSSMVLESKLSLADRVIRAPLTPPMASHSELPTPPQQHHLVPPSQVSGNRRSTPMVVSMDQDGLAALSAAAFLRLDEELGD